MREKERKGGREKERVDSYGVNIRLEFGQSCNKHVKFPKYTEANKLYRYLKHSFKTAS